MKGEYITENNSIRGGGVYVGSLPGDFGIFSFFCGVIKNNISLSGNDIYKE